MLMNILIGLAVITIVFVIVAALKPAAFHVARTAVIDAPAEDVTSPRRVVQLEC